MTGVKAHQALRLARVPGMQYFPHYDDGTVPDSWPFLKFYEPLTEGLAALNVNLATVLEHINARDLHNHSCLSFSNHSFCTSTLFPSTNLAATSFASSGIGKTCTNV